MSFRTCSLRSAHRKAASCWKIYWHHCHHAPGRSSPSSRKVAATPRSASDLGVSKQAVHKAASAALNSLREQLVTQGCGGLDSEKISANSHTPRLNTARARKAPEKSIPIQASGHCDVPISRGVKCLVLSDHIFFDSDALKDCQCMTIFDHRWTQSESRLLHNDLSTHPG
jgi:hypothetical protein